MDKPQDVHWSKRQTPFCQKHTLGCDALMLIKYPRRAWVSQRAAIKVFIMGGASLSIVMLDSHMNLRDYYKLALSSIKTRGIILVRYY